MRSRFDCSILAPSIVEDSGPKLVYEHNLRPVILAWFNFGLLMPGKEGARTGSMLTRQLAREEGHLNGWKGRKSCGCPMAYELDGQHQDVQHPQYNFAHACDSLEIALQT